MKLFVISLILLFVGCATTDQSKKEIVVTTEQIFIKHNLKVDPRLLEPCKPLVLLNGLEHKDLLLNIQDNVILYRECVNKHSSVVKVIDEISAKEKANDEKKN